MLGAAALHGGTEPDLLDEVAWWQTDDFWQYALSARPPYRYVSVEGPVVREEELDPAERLAMARRYLGSAGGSRYVADNPDPGRENVAFQMRPEYWLSQDQGKRQAKG